MSQELVDQANDLSRSGLTYSKIADQFNRNRVVWEGAARAWTRTDVELLMRHGTPDHTSEPTGRVAAVRHPPIATPKAAPGYEAAVFVSTSLKAFGVIGMFGGIVMAFVTSSADAYASSGERATGVIVSLAVGIAALTVWWSIAIIIDLLRDIARSHRA